MLTTNQLADQAFDLRAGDIIMSKTGAKNAPIGLGAELKPFRIVLAKTPSLTTPFEPKAFDGGDRVPFDLRAGPIEAAIDKLDKALLACVTTHKAKYFKKPPSDDELAQLYVPLKKEPSDPKYSGTVRTKMTLGDKPSAKFWTTDKKPLEHANISWRDSEFAVQVRLKSIWFQSNRSFGGTLEVEHVLVRQADNSCPFENDAIDESYF